MNILKKNWRKLILLLYFFAMPIISFAQVSQNPPNPVSTNPSAPPTRLKNPLGADISIPDLIKKILDGALTIGIPIIALAIIYCGFLFVAARGNPEKLTKAKDALLWTLVGAAILLGSWAIAHMISTTVTQLGS